MKNHEFQPTETKLFPEVNIVNFNRDMIVVEVEIVIEEEIITIFVVVVLIIQISKEPHEMVIIKGKLHKIRIQKVMKKHATDVV